MQAQVRLKFSTESAQLLAVSVVYPERRIERTTYRGSGFSGSSGSFTWSGAVHGLAILLLRSKLNRPAPHLAGGRGSAASAVDFAISKQPQWLIEMFAADAAGHSLIRRFVRRSNPNLKRPGPVELTILPGVSVTVESGEALVQDSEPLQAILDRLERSWRPYGGRRALDTAENTPPPVSWSIESIYQNEVSRSLANVDIFDRIALKRRIGRIISHPQFSNILGSELNSFETLCTELPSGVRLGLSSDNYLRRELCRDQPIRVAASIVSAGANAIFWYLREVKGYHIEIDNNFAHALEIANRIVAGDPELTHDICAIADVPAATLLARRACHEYSPSMLLPNVTQRVVASNTAFSLAKPAQSLLSSGSYRYLFQAPSTASIYFNHLASSGEISENQIESIHREPDEAAADLRSGDPDVRAILFFPYFNINEFINNCGVIDRPNLPDQNADMLLFGHRSFSADRSRYQALQIAIRDAWFELNSNAAARTKLVAKYTATVDFKRILQRFSGFNFTTVTAS